LNRGRCYISAGGCGFGAYQGRLPVARGIELSVDDLARRAVIMALMCQGRVCFESIEIAYLIDFGDYFAPELAELAWFEKAGLITLSPDEIAVNPRGRFFLRAICMQFDRYLVADRARNRYSKII